MRSTPFVDDIRGDDRPVDRPPDRGDDPGVIRLRGLSWLVRGLLGTAPPKEFERESTREFEKEFERWEGGVGSSLASDLPISAI
eukprot:6722957-Pyramimonas_sp.AAC.1